MGIRKLFKKLFVKDTVDFETCFSDDDWEEYDKEYEAEDYYSITDIEEKPEHDNKMSIAQMIALNSEEEIKAELDLDKNRNFIPDYLE